jgi:two-component system, NtrC family, sensor histidine kinase HydH
MTGREDALTSAKAEIDALYRLLVDQRAFAHAILDGVEGGIVTTDRDGGVTFANRCARELLGVRADISSSDVTVLLGLPDNPKNLLADLPRRLLSYPHVTADAVELDLEVTLSRGYGQGQPALDSRVGFFFIFRDVRDEKRREAERRRFEHLAAMGTMVAGFAHEVRNPVAALRSITEELAEEVASAGLELPHPSRMLRVLGRIERLVRTSLQFGRPAVPRRAFHRPWTLCSAALAGVAPRTIAAGHELHVEMEPDLPDVLVDDGQVVQALVILLDNALDAALSTQGVTLRAGRTPRAPAMVRFEVIDDGPGIAPSDISRIFDPFFTTKPTGTGLGLSIAQQIVNENGGKLTVSSGRGAPTVFSLLVPTTGTTTTTSDGLYSDDDK